MGIEQNQSQEEHEWSRSATDLIILHEEGKLNKRLVNTWLETMPKNDRDIAYMDLENGLSEDIENLPE